MAEQFYPIRSVKGYIKEFGIDAIGKKHADPDLVKQQILDAFHKEIFNQLTTMCGDPDLFARDVSQVDPEVKRKADNILSNSIRKWKRLCIEFSRYKETYNLLFPSDLMVSLEDIVGSQIGENPKVETSEDPEEIIYMEDASNEEG